MNIKDIEDFRLSDAVEFHSELNPLLFRDEKLQKDVRDPDDTPATAEDHLADLTRYIILFLEDSGSGVVRIEGL